MEEGADPPEGRIGKDDEIAEMLNTQAREREDRKAKKRKNEADRKEKLERCKARLKNKMNKAERLKMAAEEVQESEKQLRELQDQFSCADLSEEQALALRRQIERNGDYLATVSIYRR